MYYKCALPPDIFPKTYTYPDPVTITTTFTATTPTATITQTPTTITVFDFVPLESYKASSNTCRNEEYDAITSKQMCDKAARQLGQNTERYTKLFSIAPEDVPTGAETPSFAGYTPFGCYLDATDVTNPRIYFVDAVPSTPAEELSVLVQSICIDVAATSEANVLGMRCNCAGYLNGATETDAELCQLSATNPAEPNHCYPPVDPDHKQWNTRYNHGCALGAVQESDCKQKLCIEACPPLTKESSADDYYAYVTCKDACKAPTTASKITPTTASNMPLVSTPTPRTEATSNEILANITELDGNAGSQRGGSVSGKINSNSGKANSAPIDGNVTNATGFTATTEQAASDSAGKRRTTGAVLGVALPILCIAAIAGAVVCLQKREQRRQRSFTQAAGNARPAQVQNNPTFSPQGNAARAPPAAAASGNATADGCKNGAVDYLDPDPKQPGEYDRINATYAEVGDAPPVVVLDPAGYVDDHFINNQSASAGTAVFAVPSEDAAGEVQGQGQPQQRGQLRSNRNAAQFNSIA